MNISQIVNNQRAFFETGASKSVSFRKEALKGLYAAIKKYESEISEALFNDLGKSPRESYMCEIGLALSEISFMRRRLASFARPKRVFPSLAQLPAMGKIYKEPYGVCLIMSPWNYPFLLTTEPLVAALAAGNTAVLKPSAYSPAVSRVIEKIVSEVFPPEYVCVLTGGREVNSAVLEEKFDYIFFTGGNSVGRLVLEKAAKNFTPVTLEMGGKSPCIVDKTANLEEAAKRICFGKLLNAGQTCVAPDYILIEKSVHDKFAALLIKSLESLAAFPLANPDYGKIINEKHFDRLLGLIDEKKVAYGGGYDRAALKIEPTVMLDVSASDSVMGEEIFGPILPLIKYETTDNAIQFIKSFPRPLALYHFSRDNGAIERVRSEVSFGGGCVNDCVMHLASSRLPFGGVGNSGMGNYHGKYGFDTFSHEKSVLCRPHSFDFPLRYNKDKFTDFLIRRFLG